MTGPIDHSGTSKWALEIKTNSGKTIKKLFENISTFLKSVDIKFFPQGIYICASDTAKYILISVTLHSQPFLKYYCPNRTKITVDVGSFISALTHANTTETLTFIMTEADSRVLHLIFESKGKKRVHTKVYGSSSTNKTFRVPKPSILRPMVFKASEFQSDIRSMCPYSHLLTFVTNYKDFHIMASGDQGSTAVQIFPEPPDVVEKLKNLDLNGEQMTNILEPQLWFYNDSKPASETQPKLAECNLGGHDSTRALIRGLSRLPVCRGADGDRAPRAVSASPRSTACRGGKPPSTPAAIRPLSGDDLAATNSRGKR